MTNYGIDNALGADYGKVVLWQYDHAYNLLRLIDLLATFFRSSVADFWNAYPSAVTAIDTCGTFGLIAWGLFLGMPRPFYNANIVNDRNAQQKPIPKPVSDDLYRRVLKSRFALMAASGSIEDICTAVGGIFSVPGHPDQYGFTVKDLGEMAMEYDKDTTYWGALTSEQRLLFLTANCAVDGSTAKMSVFDSARALLPYPAGIRYSDECAETVFGFEGQEPSDSSADPTVGGFCEKDGDDTSFSETTFISGTKPAKWKAKT